MTTLPLYPQVPRLAVEDATPRSLNHACTRCPLSGLSVNGGIEIEQKPAVRHVCIGADGKPGGVLIVGDAPTAAEDAAGRPFVSTTGAYLRKTVAGIYTGPVVYDLAVRCAPGKATKRHMEMAVEQCRPYLAGTYGDAQPERIVTVGAHATAAVLGRTVAAMQARRAYAWTSTRVPVFVVIPPLGAMRNRFVRSWFESDMRWALTGTPPVPPQWDALLHVVRVDNVHQAVTALRAEPRGLTYDCETGGAQHNPEFTLLSVAACARGSDATWVWDRAALQHPVTRAALAALMADPRVPKTGQNVKYDNLTIECALGVQVRGTAFDTRLALKVMDAEADAKLATLSELVGMGGHKDEMGDAIVAGRKAIRNAIKAGSTTTLVHYGNDPALDAAAVHEVANDGDVDRYAYAYTPEATRLRYNARDTLSTDRVADLMEQRLTRDAPAHVANVWREIVHPASLAIERMEATGIAADVEHIKMFSAYITLQQMPVLEKLSKYGGINWNSPMQVAKLLFETLKLPSIKKTETGLPSTDDEALEAISTYHPVVGDILRNRKFEKLQGQYAAGMLLHVRADGRIHPNFNLDGARSGRLSCSNPNGQNIPSPGNDEKGQPQWGKMARDCFAAMTGDEAAHLQGNRRKVILEFDYSQLELRIAAYMSGDVAMREVFESGVDYHLKTAQDISHLWKIKPEEVQKIHRGQAKVVNFALLYGKSDAGMAMQIGCTTAEAAAVRRAVLSKFHRLDAWIKESLAYARRTGECKTAWNGKDARVRPLWRIAEPEKNVAENAERSSWNTRIQGTAADFCTASLAVINAWIAADGVPARLILSVHDSIMIECEEHCADEVHANVTRIMQAWHAGGVPIVVDCKVGRAWGSLVEVEKGHCPSQHLKAEA